MNLSKPRPPDPERSSLEGSGEADRPWTRFMREIAGRLGAFVRLLVDAPEAEALNAQEALRRTAHALEETKGSLRESEAR